VKYRWLLIPLLVFLASRLFVFAAGEVGDIMLPTDSNHWTADPNSTFLSMWAKWDSQYYIDIASNGYAFNPEKQSNVAFFPLYPLMIRVGATLSAGNLVLAGFWVSNLALLGALILLYLLAQLELGEPAAGRSVIYLAFFPTSFFLSCVYTESVFLFLTIGAIYAARRQKWVIASLLGLLASATGNIGVLVWLLVFWEWIRVQGFQLTHLFKKEMWRTIWSGARRNWLQAFVICLIPLGILAYMLFLKYNFEQPLAFIQTQANFGRENIGLFAMLKNNIQTVFAGAMNKGRLTIVWNLIPLLGFLALVPFIWKRLGEGYAVYVFIQLLIPATSTSGSMIRYVLTSFPAFLLLADLGKRPWVDRLITTFFVLFLGVLTTLFVNWIFVA